MALSAVPQSTGQQTQTTPQVSGPGGRSVRERFNELTTKQQDAILEANRDINVFHDDWNHGVIDGFKADMEAIGILVDRPFYSGFWSQGDGACFQGHIRDFDLFLPTLKYTDPALIKLAEDHWWFRVSHRGFYYHENCTYFDVDMPLPDDSDDNDFANAYMVYEEGSLHRAVALTNLARYTSSKLEEEFIEAFKSHMRDLYDRLESEYDHLTSDEAVLEALEANDMLEDLINDAMENEYA